MNSRIAFDIKSYLPAFDNIYTELETSWCYSEENTEVFRSAKGAYIESYDGQKYLDFKNGLGAVLLGHNDDDVNTALVDYLRDNDQNLFGPTDLHAKVADRLVQDVNTNFGICFFPSGSSAVKAAADVLKIFTKKDIIVSAGYHGWDLSWCLGADLLQPNRYGVIDFFFCLDYFEEILVKHREEIAGVVISPDYMYLQDNWYQLFFDLCRHHQVFLILDDVKQGYRYSQGLSVDRFDYQGNLNVVSKCISNGLPLTSVVGDKNLLELMKSWASTGYYNTLPFVAADVVLEKLRRLDIQQTISQVGEVLLAKLSDMFKHAKLPIEIVGSGNLFQFVFGSHELEKSFYEIGLDNRLLFFKGDNQSLSYAFDSDVVSQAINAFGNLIDRLADEFKLLKGTEIPLVERWRAAYRSMEGIPLLNQSRDTRDEFIKKYIFTD